MTQKKLESRREIKKVALRLHIVNTAMKLFNKQGFESTTMEAIAENAGVTKRTLYSYFPVKEAIISAHWIYTTENNSKRIPILFKLYRSTQSRLTKICLAGAKRIKANPEFARIHFSYQIRLLSQPVGDHLQSEFVNVLTSVIEAGQAQGDVRGDISANELALQIRQHFTAICLMWFENPSEFSLDGHITNAVECFIHGAGRSPQA